MNDLDKEYDIESILYMSNESVINEQGLEYKYTDEQVCKYFDISLDELKKIKYTHNYDIEVVSMRGEVVEIKLKLTFKNCLKLKEFLKTLPM